MWCLVVYFYELLLNVINMSRNPIWVKSLLFNKIFIFNSRRQNVSQYHWEKTTVLLPMVKVTEVVQRRWQHKVHYWKHYQIFWRFRTHGSWLYDRICQLLTCCTSVFSMMALIGVTFCALLKKNVFIMDQIYRIICCSFCVRVTTNGVAAQTGILWIRGRKGPIWNSSMACNLLTNCNNIEISRRAKM